MSFIEIERRISATPTNSGVAVSFRIVKRSIGKPSCVISLRAAFLASSGFGEAATYRAALGSDDDAGLIRIWPDATGPFTARETHGARVLDLGHIAAFGARSHKCRRAVVEMVDGAAVITLPAAAEMDDESEEGDAPAAPVVGKPAAQVHAPSTPAAARPAAKPASGPAAPASPQQIVTYNGITICRTAGCEHVTFKGADAEVSPRGAHLVEMLAKVMPNCIDDVFLTGKLWTTRPPGWTTSLDMIVTDLKSLKGIGLEVRTQRGVGRQLVVL